MEAVAKKMKTQTQFTETSIASFDDIPIDYTWSFSDKTQKDTNYITHGYYTYPAKFIPQLASRLICKYSEKGDVVVDPFMGSGTTVVESLVNERMGAGTDINEIAFLVAKAKTMPLDSKKVQQELNRIQSFIPEKEVSLFSDGNINLTNLPKLIPENDRIDYWFSEEQKNQLGVLLYLICENNDENVRDFFLVAFAQILKSASIWMQKSIKPTRDKNKNPASSFYLFFTQCKKMIKKNDEYNSVLSDDVKNNLDNFLNIKCGDSRFLPLDDEVAQMVVTSPPYVTSYEYADLHQLPLLWFGYLDTLSDFRKKFIGSSFKERNEIDLKSHIAENIVAQLKNKKTVEVQNYFADMLETFEEMYRVLKPHGKACVVIGNTQFRGVDILNAEVFVEQMQNIGFGVHEIIHREIPSKMLPSTRDAATGRFAKTSETDKLVYPTEYILVMEKI